MTTYLLKTILCSGIFYGFYFLFLEKEKMHRFNRFYLLITLILSFSIPLITLEKQADILPVAPWLVSSPNAPASAHEQILLSQEWLVGTPTTGRNYKVDNFSNMYISRLEGAAKKGRTYDFQVDLMTNDFYENYRKKATERPIYKLDFTTNDTSQLAKVIK